MLLHMLTSQQSHELSGLARQPCAPPVFGDLWVRVCPRACAYWLGRQCSHWPEAGPAIGVKSYEPDICELFMGQQVYLLAA